MDLLAHGLYYHTIQCVLIQGRTECSEQWLDLVHFNTKMCNWMHSFFLSGGSSAAILLGWFWTVVNQSWRFPTTPSGVNPKVRPKRKDNLPKSKKKQISSWRPCHGGLLCYPINNNANRGNTTSLSLEEALKLDKASWYSRCPTIYLTRSCSQLRRWLRYRYKYKIRPGGIFQRFYLYMLSEKQIVNMTGKIMESVAVERKLFGLFFWVSRRCSWVTERLFGSRSRWCCCAPLAIPITQLPPAFTPTSSIDHLTLKASMSFRKSSKSHAPRMKVNY